MMSTSCLASNYFQGAHGTSAFATGLALLPMGLASLVSALFVPNLINKVGTGGAHLAGVLAQIIGAALLAAGRSRRPGGRGRADRHRRGPADLLRPAVRHRRPPYAPRSRASARPCSTRSTRAARPLGSP